MNDDDYPPTPDTAERRLLDALESTLGDDFQIVRKLGRGSMATVYQAREQALGRMVAVKVLRPGRANDGTARRRFEREARAAASLVHPRVVQVFRFGRLPDGTPYLVMRFVKGRTMEERLQAEGQLPTELVRQVLCDVAEALAAAHARGIVHRDVRPANVLWDEEDGSAHLTDFGIAALMVSMGEETSRLTQTGQMIGDPRYLSPEQLRDEDLTPLVDMYAFGVMGYELYSGEGPYAARTNTQLIAGHLSGEPRPLSSLRPDVDPAVADLLRRCLNRDPNHRPRAVDAARILKGETAAVARKADQSDLSELLRRRVPQIVILSGGAGLSLIGLMGELVDRGTVDPVLFPLTLAFVACGFVASMVVGWFHGERGPQKATVLEWVVLGIIGVIWLVLSAWIVGGA